ncbi:hypothetical protein D3C85_1555900 [compost metagenome]
MPGQAGKVTTAQAQLAPGPRLAQRQAVQRQYTLPALHGCQRHDAQAGTMGDHADHPIKTVGAHAYL